MSTCCLKNSFRHCSWHRLRPGWRPADDDDDDDNEGDDADGAWGDGPGFDTVTEEVVDSPSGSGTGGFTFRLFRLYDFGFWWPVLDVDSCITAVEGEDG